MYSKCGCHITETISAFTRVSDLLKNLKNFNPEYNLCIKDYTPVIDINENSSVGDQIKHYKQLKGIQQKDIENI